MHYAFRNAGALCRRIVSKTELTIYGRLVTCKDCLERLAMMGVFQEIGMGTPIPAGVVLALVAEVTKSILKTDGVYSTGPADVNRVFETLAQHYDPARPCQWKLDCLMTGRCPKDPVCNN